MPLRRGEESARCMGQPSQLRAIVASPRCSSTPSLERNNTAQQPPRPIAKMLFSPFGLLAAASGLLSLTSAHNIQMKAHQRECFHEQLHKDDKMTVTFQVGDREFGGSGNLEIDFWV